MKEIFPGVFERDGQLLTRSLVPGQRSFKEDIVTEGGAEYRVWNPYRSKIAAAIRKGLKELGVRDGSRVLYLGAANGHTVSFLSDIVGAQGAIYAVEISTRAMKDLLELCKARKNVFPALCNARTVEYSWVGPVDFAFADIAARDQAEIFERNCKTFLSKEGSCAIAIKSRSIDVTKNPEKVFEEQLAKLSGWMQIAQSLRLEPFEKDHLFVNGKIKAYR